MDINTQESKIKIYEESKALANQVQFKIGTTWFTRADFAKAFKTDMNDAEQKIQWLSKIAFLMHKKREDKIDLFKLVLDDQERIDLISLEKDIKTQKYFAEIDFLNDVIKIINLSSANKTIATEKAN